MLDGKLDKTDGVHEQGTDDDVDDNAVDNNRQSPEDNGDESMEDCSEEDEESDDVTADNEVMYWISKSCLQFTRSMALPTVYDSIKK
jgi:hypothetical protein